MQISPNEVKRGQISPTKPLTYVEKLRLKELTMVKLERRELLPISNTLFKLE